MAPRVDDVPSDPDLPARIDVVVIGGGIIGSSAALFLARKGIAVALCEKGRIGAEQSSRNWGWVRKMGRDPRELPLIIESLRLWGQLNEITGAETGFRVCGITYLAETPQQLAAHEAWLEHARAYQLDTRMLSGKEAAALFPGSSVAWAGAMHTPSDGRGEPQMAAPAIAEAARRAGAAVLTGCAVRGVETAGGKVAAVVTERGRIACDAVVLAGGAWSSLFCGNVGVRLPQLKMRASVMRVEKLDGGPDGSASGPGFGFRKRLDGGYNVSALGERSFELVPDMFRYWRDFLPTARIQRQGLRVTIGRRSAAELRLRRRWSLDEATPFEAMRVLDPEPDHRFLDAAQRTIAKVFPVFGNAVPAERWAGLIDVTPDLVPVISSVASVPGFYIATGFSGHGFGIGPAAGRLMADLVAGDPPIVDPAPFRYARFIDGSHPRPMAPAN